MGLYKGLNQAVASGRALLLGFGKLLLDVVESALGDPDNLRTSLASIVTGLKNVIPELKAWGEQWVDHYEDEETSDEERVSMIGELTGQIIAMIMAAISGGRAGKSLGGTTARGTAEAVVTEGVVAEERKRVSV